MLTISFLVYFTEPEVGIALQEAQVPRSSFWVTTKAVDVNDIVGSLEKSLEKLKLSYVDM